MNEFRPPEHAAPAGAPDTPALVIRFWGVRGSVPAPGAGTARYGGNTSCAEVVAADGRRLVLDAGTGLRALGDALLGDAPLGDAMLLRDVRAADAARADADVALLVTHAHADHLHGLPFFAPLSRGRGAVVAYAGAAHAEAVGEAARALLRPPLFPKADGMLARLAVSPLADGVATAVHGFAVRAVAAAHPGGAAGFRVEDAASGRALVYLPDNELATVDDVDGGRRALIEAVAGVNLLVHDATYLPAELADYRGWGHSSYAEAVRLAADAGVGRLVLFHHHPARDDDAVDRLLRAAQALGAAARPPVDVDAAREGEALAV